MGSHQAVVLPSLVKYQCHNSIGISPPPGTPQAAPFGYWSIIVPCKCHRPNLRHFEVLLRISFIARSLSGGHGAPTISANSAAHGHLTSNVLDEWLFSFQGSTRGFYLSPDNGHFFRFCTVSHEIFFIFFLTASIWLWIVVAAKPDNREYSRTEILGFMQWM